MGTMRATGLLRSQTVPHELDMGAELRLEVTDVHGFHVAMVAHLTK
jgi:hypothetical protein